MPRPLTDRYERELQRLHEQSPAPYRFRAGPSGPRFLLRLRLRLLARGSAGRRLPRRRATVESRPG